MSLLNMPGPRYFGDESGNFRGLLSGNEQYFGVAVVKGEASECARCPKRAVRRASGVEEARWSDLTDVQRRRVSDCIQSVDGLEAAVAVIESRNINRLTHGYVLRQDSLEYDNDMVVLACLYGAALAQLDIMSVQNPQFTFDRCISVKMSNQVCELLQNSGLPGVIEHRASKAVRGIQLADCVIGAFVSDRYAGTEYLAGGPVTEITTYGLAVLEKTLSDLRAGP